jgi:hypothetical protein
MPRSMVASGAGPVGTAVKACRRVCLLMVWLRLWAWGLAECFEDGSLAAGRVAVLVEFVSQGFGGRFLVAGFP